jgi:hypothetical protein
MSEIMVKGLRWHGEKWTDTFGDDVEMVIIFGATSMRRREINAGLE